MVVVLMLCAKCKRPSQIQRFDAAVEALIQGNTQQQLPHLAQYSMLEKICVLSVSEYKLKSDFLCESVFKCYSEVIICIIYV